MEDMDESDRRDRKEQGNKHKPDKGYCKGQKAVEKEWGKKHSNTKSDNRNGKKDV